MTRCTFILLIALLFVIYTYPADGRGGRGGSGARFSSRSRYGSSRFTSVRQRIRIRKGSPYRYQPGIRYRSLSRYQKIELLTYGAIFISLQHRHRYGSGYYRSSGRDIQICYNNYDKPYANSTSPYGLFMCPLDNDFSKIYCCGRPTRQYCCTYFSDSGRLAGLVIGLLIAFGVIVGVAICCYKKSRKRRPNLNVAVNVPMNQNYTKTASFDGVPSKTDLPPTYPVQPNDSKDGPIGPPPYNTGYPPAGPAGYPPMPGPNSYTAGYPSAPPTSTNPGAGYAGGHVPYGLQPNNPPPDVPPPDYSTASGMPQPNYGLNPAAPQYNPNPNPYNTATPPYPT